MDLKRFFASQPIVGNTAFLEGKEYIHAVKIIRVKTGYKLIVCDGSPYDFYGTVTKINKDNLEVYVEKKVSNNTEIDRRITLYIGINKDLDTVTQKAVELGVKRIIPFTSQHTNVEKINIDRLQSIILESSKQCGRSVLATIEEPITFDQAVLQMKDDFVFAFYEYESKNHVSDFSVTDKQPISILIGCEGGFSTEEYRKMKDNNFATVSLGKRILRVATAVVSACTLVNEKIGEL